MQIKGHILMTYFTYIRQYLKELELLTTLFGEKLKKNSKVKAIKVALLDGVLYIKGQNKMFKSITDAYKDYNIMSALVLREFLYQL